MTAPFPAMLLVLTACLGDGVDTEETDTETATETDVDTDSDTDSDTDTDTDTDTDVEWFDAVAVALQIETAWDGAALSGWVGLDGEPRVPSVEVRLYEEEYLTTADLAYRCTWWGEVDDLGEAHAGAMWTARTLALRETGTDCERLDPEVWGARGPGVHLESLAPVVQWGPLSQELTEQWEEVEGWHEGHRPYWLGTRLDVGRGPKEAGYATLYPLGERMERIEGAERVEVTELKQLPAGVYVDSYQGRWDVDDLL